VENRANLFLGFGNYIFILYNYIRKEEEEEEEKEKKKVKK
jgi:hypothetical protein